MMDRKLYLAAACGLALASPAFAQRALDHNLQVGTGGVNAARPDLATELRFRNAIVTGNAPGGLSFRGNVGYRAPGEVQTNLAGDSTFGFRRDSVISGLGGQGVRGTDALQYQFAMTTGNGPPAGLGLNPIYNRAGARSTSGYAESQQPGTRFEPGNSIAGRFNSREEGDPGLSLMAARSPSSFDANRGLQPSVLGIMAGARGEEQQITASGLRGISFEPMPKTPTDAEPGQPGAVPPQTPGGFGNPGLPGPAKTGQKPEPRPGAGPLPAGINTAAPSEQNDLRLNSATRSPYDELLERMSADAGEARGPKSGVPTSAFEANGGKPDKKKNAKDDIPDWQRRLDELRKELSGRHVPGTIDDQIKPKKGAVKPDESDDSKNPSDKNGDKSKNDDGKGDNAKGDKAKGDKAKSGRGVNPETADMIRRAGGRVAVLAQPGFDAYATQMQAGQEHLAAGRFFDAEERFAAALSAKNGDPMAAVGRIHAELGAGMFMSAAINLKALLTANPEVAGIRFAPELLPSKDRAAKVMERLSEPDRGREGAMLLAYLAFQTGDRATTARALDVMAKAPQGAPAEGDDLTRLATLLRGVWLAPETPAPAPRPPAPATPDANK